MQSQFHIIFAQCTDRVLDMDLPFVERDIELLLELVGDHAGGDGPEHFAVIAGLDLDDANEFGHAFGQLAHGVELVGLAFAPVLLERFDAAFVGLRERNRKALGKQVIAGVAGGDLDVVGLGAQADDIAGEDDFSF